MSGKYERELINSVRELGYNGLRTPSSGSSTKTELPDFILSVQYTDNQIIEYLHENSSMDDVETMITVVNRLTNFSKVIGGELKSKSEKRIYIDESEIIDLNEFCRTFGAEPRIAIRFTTKDTPVKTYLLHPSDVPQTKSDYYKITATNAEEQALEIIRHSSKNKNVEIERNKIGTTNYDKTRTK
jgi:Holliday junction resolvase